MTGGLVATLAGSDVVVGERVGVNTFGGDGFGVGFFVGEAVESNKFCGGFVVEDATGEATGDTVVFTTGDEVGFSVVDPVVGTTVVWVTVGTEVDDDSSSFFLVGENVFTFANDVGECVLTVSSFVDVAIVGDRVESTDAAVVVVGASVS